MTVIYSSQIDMMPEKRYITMRHFDLKRKFVPLSHFEKCMEWLDKQKKYSNHILADIKQHNQENILEAHRLLEQKSHNDSNSYREFVMGTEDGKQLSIQQDKVVVHEYNKLLEENINNLRTLKTFLEISILESPIRDLSLRIDDTAKGVVQEFRPTSGSAISHENLNGPHVSKCLQELEGIKSSWGWIEDLLKCLILHVRHASSYCQFHHDLHALFDFISQFRASVDVHRCYDDSYSSALHLAGEIQAAEVALKSLEDKVISVTSAFQHVVPIHMRTQESVESVPGVLICRYATKEVDLKAGEDVTVVDRSSLYTWRVKTNSGVVVTLPSIIVVVDGHDDDSAEALVRLHKLTEELIDWTVEKVNERLTTFLLKVFKKKYTKEEVTLICNLPEKTKMNLSNFIDAIFKSLPQKNKCQDVLELERRLSGLRGLMEPLHSTENDFPSDGNSFGRALVVQLNILQYLLEMFQGLKFLKEERPKFSLDLPKRSLKTPMDNVDLKEEFFDVEEVIMKIDEIIYNTRLADEELKEDETINTQNPSTGSSLINHIRDLSEFAQELEGPQKHYMDEFTIPSKILMAPESHSPINGLYDTVDFRRPVPFQKLLWRGTNEWSDFSTKVKISETEQLFATKSEEDKKFVIKSVVDPKTGEDISLSDALKGGIIDASSGVYLHRTDPRETMSISAAMHQNLIKVQSTTVRKSWEKKSSVCLVTVKTQTKVERKGWIETVFDFSSETHIDIGEAERMGLVDLSRNVLKDLKNEREYTFEEAEDHGWIGRSKLPEEEMPETKVTYVVWGVLDRRREKMIPYHEACREGLMDRVTSTYYDLLSDKKYPIEEAIDNNFVKAEVIEDPKNLDLWRDT